MSNLTRKKAQASGTSYTVGFLLSLFLTLAASVLVTQQLLEGWLAAYVLVALATTQLLVQLVFFLHVGHESKPRLNLLALLFAGLVVSIVVVGSLWIMNNLNYNMMSKQETGDYIIKDEDTPMDHTQMYLR